MSQLTLEHIPIQAHYIPRTKGGVCVWGWVGEGGGAYLKRPSNFSGLFAEMSKVRIRKENAFFVGEFSSKSCFPTTEKKIS